MQCMEWIFLLNGAHVHRIWFEAVSVQSTQIARYMCGRCAEAIVTADELNANKE